MMMQPLLAAMIGGWEIILILGVLVMLTLGIAVAAGVIYLIVRTNKKKANPAPPPMLPPTQHGGQ